MGCMRKSTQLINIAVAGFSAVVLLTTACAGSITAPFSDASGPSPSQAATALENDPGSDGVSLETITVGEQQVLIPVGLRLPEVEITHADESYIVMASPEKKPVVDAVKESAVAAGYEIYAEGTHGVVLIGHGNAVLLAAKSQVQMLTWGPESMKDVLSE